MMDSCRKENCKQKILVGQDSLVDKIVNKHVSSFHCLVRLEPTTSEM